MVLFPVLGILPSGTTAANYANNNIFLFMGGFILALGIQRWGLHRRIALHVVSVIGTNPARMVLGFMLATAFSFDVDLQYRHCPHDVTDRFGSDRVPARGSAGEGSRWFCTGPAAGCRLLGIDWWASRHRLEHRPISLSYELWRFSTPRCPPITFGRWFLAFLPMVAVFLPIAWFVLTRVAHRLERAGNRGGKGGDPAGDGPSRGGEHKRAPHAVGVSR